MGSNSTLIYTSELILFPPLISIEFLKHEWKFGRISEKCCDSLFEFSQTFTEYEDPFVGGRPI